MQKHGWQFFFSISNCKLFLTQVDPLVSLMMVEKVPDSTYEMVGGLDKQIKEIKEVLNLLYLYICVRKYRVSLMNRVKDTHIWFFVQIVLYTHMSISKNWLYMASEWEGENWNSGGFYRQRLNLSFGVVVFCLTGCLLFLFLFKSRSLSCLWSILSSLKP